MLAYTGNPEVSAVESTLVLRGGAGANLGRIDTTETPGSDETRNYGLEPEAFLPWPGGAEAASCWLRRGGRYCCSLPAKHEHRAVASTLSSLVLSSNETSDGACCRSRRESRRRGRAIGGGCRVIAQTKVEWETPIVDPPRCEVPSHLLRWIGHETNGANRARWGGSGMPPTPQAGPWRTRTRALRGRAVRDEECLSAHATYD